MNLRCCWCFFSPQALLIDCMLQEALPTRKSRSALITPCTVITPFPGTAPLYFELNILNTFLNTVKFCRVMQLTSTGHTVSHFLSVEQQEPWPFCTLPHAVELVNEKPNKHSTCCVFNASLLASLA